MSHLLNVNFLKKESQHCEFYVCECWILLYSFKEFWASLGASPINCRLFWSFQFLGFCFVLFFALLGCIENTSYLELIYSPQILLGTVLNVLCIQWSPSVMDGGNSKLCGLLALLPLWLLALHICILVFSQTLGDPMWFLELFLGRAHFSR